MHKFVDATGKPVSDTDPNRLLWYGMCGFWTDNWLALTHVGPGIPACPNCKVPGFQITALKWFDGASKYEAAQKKEGYLDFVVKNRETCFQGKWMEVYEQQRKKIDVEDNKSAEQGGSQVS